MQRSAAAPQPFRSFPAPIRSGGKDRRGSSPAQDHRCGRCIGTRRRWLPTANSGVEPADARQVNEADHRLAGDRVATETPQSGSSVQEIVGASIGRPPSSSPAPPPLSSPRKPSSGKALASRWDHRLDFAIGEAHEVLRSLGLPRQGGLRAKYSAARPRPHGSPRCGRQTGFDRHGSSVPVVSLFSRYSVHVAGRTPARAEFLHCRDIAEAHPWRPETQVLPMSTAAIRRFAVPTPEEPISRRAACPRSGARRRNRAQRVLPHIITRPGRGAVAHPSAEGVFGGFEYDGEVALKIAMTISAACASTGWAVNGAVSNGRSIVTSRSKPSARSGRRRGPVYLRPPFCPHRHRSSRWWICAERHLVVRQR